MLIQIVSGLAPWRRSKPVASVSNRVSMSFAQCPNSGQASSPSSSLRAFARISFLSVVPLAVSALMACSPATTLPEGRCASKADCPAEQICAFGYCTDAPVVVDAGTTVDAGPVDALTSDALVPVNDAGTTVDSGVLDAGVEDAATIVDAAMTDASFSDSGAPSAADSGTSFDGGGAFPDAGLSDAGDSATDGGFDGDAGFEDAGQGFRCTRPRDCFLDEFCNTVTGQCETLQCDRDDRCPERYECDTFLQRCVFSGCQSDTDCLFGVERCDLISGACLPLLGGGCTSHFQCGVQEHCDYDTGICMPGRKCAWDANCFRNQRCGPDKVCLDIEKCGTALECLDDQECMSLTGAAADYQCLEVGSYCVIDPDTGGDNCGDFSLRCDPLSSRCVRSGQCTSDAYCRRDLGEACDPTTKTCVFPLTPCSGSAQCRADQRCHPDLKRCIAKLRCNIDTEAACGEGEVCVPGSGECIDEDLDALCTSNDDCEEDVEVCDLSLSQPSCVEVAGAGSCLSSADCLDNELCIPQDNGSNRCTPSEPPPECGADLPCEEPAKVCDLDENKCIGIATCQGDIDCLGNETCNPDTNQCEVLPEPAACGVDEPCEAEDEICDLEDAKCIVVATCNSDADCLGNESCDPETNQCVVIPPPAACSETDPCEEEGTVCDVESGECITVAQCQGDADCEGNEECNTDTNRCQTRSDSRPDGDCLENADGCEAGETCAAEADENGNIVGVCVIATSGTACESDADCRDGTECNRAENECMALSEDPPDSDCFDGGESCEAGETCAFDGERGVCVVATTGNDCESDADCRDNTECNFDTKECVERSENAPDSDCLEQGQGCEPGETCAFDGERGVCVVATSGADCQGDADCRDNTFCNAETNQCEEASEPTGCSQEEPCENPGEVCDLENNECVLTAGGTSCDTSEDCRSDEVCAESLEGERTCEPVPACESDEECDVGRMCDVLTGRCLSIEENEGCNSAAECGPGMVCRIPGGVCDLGGSCGRCIVASSTCATDTDCGGGQYCNLDTGLCDDVERCVDQDQDGQPDDPNCVDLRCASDESCPGSLVCNLCYGVCHTSASSCESSEECLCGWSCTFNESADGQAGVCLRGGGGTGVQ